MEALFDEEGLKVFMVIVFAGLTGTLLMTLFMNLMSYLSKNGMTMHKVLTTMLTFGVTYKGDLPQQRRAAITGYVAHYSIGVMFMCLYYILWVYGVGAPDLVSGIGFGAAGGIISIAFWYWFFVIHPNPPSVPLRPYFVNVFLAHFVYALGAIGAFNFFNAAAQMV